MPAVPIVRSVQDVVDSLKIARGRPRDDEWGGVTFLVGAGCSRGAGIPLADAIARELVVDLAHSLSDTQTFAEADAALQWLKANGKLAQDLPWPRVYGQIFEDYYKDAPTQQRILARFVDAATGINWAHACLGELVRAHLVNTVVTTNFDQLVLDGMIRSDILPTIADGIRALDRIEGQPGYPQLIHIHGSRRTYQLRNSVTATTDYAASHPVVRAISELLRSTPALVVVGYAGAEEGIMAALLDAARNASPCPPIYWILYSDAVTDLSPGAHALLACSSGGGVVPGQDADDFFASIMRGMKLEGPGWLVRPIEQLKERARRVAIPSQPLLAGVVESYLKRIDALTDAPAPEQRLEQFRALSIGGQSAEAFDVLKPDLLNLDAPGDLEALGDAAYESGRTKVASDHLRVATAVYRRALGAWTSHRDKARTSKKLGDALQEFARHRRDPAPVDEAIAAYQESLAYLSDVPPNVDSAVAHVSLGAAYRLSSALRSDPALLHNALTEYQAALQFYTPEGMPVEWATAQLNMAVTLLALGQVEVNAARFDRAIEACTSALERLDPTAHRPRWLRAILNLATSLLERARFDSGPARIDEAIATFNLGLKTMGRNADDLLEAHFRASLATALLTRGQIAGEKQQFAFAIGELETARRLRPRDKVESLWASTQVDLAEAWLVQSMNEESPNGLAAAGSTCLESLDVITKAKQRTEWARAQALQGRILFHVGLRAADHETLTQAIGRLAEALEQVSRTSDAILWAETAQAAATAMTEVARRTQTTGRADEALRILGDVLSINRRDVMPLRWASSMRARCRAQWTVAALRDDAALAAEALAGAKDAASVLGPSVEPVEWSQLLLLVAEIALRREQQTTGGEAVAAVGNALDDVARVNLRDLAPLLWAHSRRLRGERDALDLAADPAAANRAADHFGAALDVYRRCRALYDVAATEQLLASVRRS